VFYETFNFTIDQADVYTFAGTGAGDLTASLYGGGFDPLNACANLLAYNDDGNFNGSLDPLIMIQLDLVPGVYTLVMATFQNGVVSDYTFDFSSDNGGNILGSGATTSPIDGGSTDNCDGQNLTFSHNITDFTCDNLGENIVTLTVTDASGNSDTCSATVTIIDDQAPTVDDTTTPDIEAECNVTLTAPTTQDNCAGQITATTEDALEYTEIGDYTVTWTFDDGNGNVSLSMQNIAIIEGPNCPIVGAPTARISPILECVRQDANGGFIAVFGYDNDNDVTVSIPVGADNKLTPNDNNDLLVTEFLSGRQVAVFEVPFDGGNLVWSLRGPDGNNRTATASENSQLCEIEAEGCYAMEVISYEPTQQSNGNAIAQDRSNPQTALGEPDRANAPGGFVSLGVEGRITLKFAGAVYDAPGPDIAVFETSFSNNNPESALVEVSQDGIEWVFATELISDGTLDIGGLQLDYVSQIRITDLGQTSGDGYDVDGVEAINGCEDLPSQGDVCYGAFVVENSYMPGNKKNGNPITDPMRTDPAKALGAPQNDDTFNFVSLGYGGEITIGFDGAVLNQDGDDIEIVETTFGSSNFESYPEAAEVYVSQDGFNFYSVGIVLTGESARFDITNASVSLAYITQVKLVDVTPAGSPSTDGFDLDGIISISGCTILEEPNTCFSEIVNGSFEDDNTFVGPWKYVDESNVPGWATTSPTGTIEIQRSGMVNGNASSTGDFHFELNGDGLNTIYQEICTTPGANIKLSFSHKKRLNSGVDMMEIYFGNSLTDIESQTAYPFIAAAGAGWEAKQVVYEVPLGQESTFVYFKAISGTSSTIGNLLDDISVSVTSDFPTDAQELLAALDVNEHTALRTEVSIFPVPASDVLNLKISGHGIGSVSYEIISSIGRSLKKENINAISKDNTFVADISYLADGTYFLLLNIDGTLVTKTFIKSEK
ncbi:T9SS type A sorting domain-containing protein, partial [Psychroserpens sp.]|uniref:T9SS type A sorting domain-containing protein n=1 Tax=Psychroserpens sp. TaxID=2020870 RepID=UPI003C74BBC3